MDGAAINGHLHVVEWLHLNRQEGCDYKAFEGANLNGHKDVKAYLKENQRTVLEKHNLLCQINKEEKEERERRSEFDDRIQLKRRRLFQLFLCF